jgi:hypothetical protein
MPDSAIRRRRRIWSRIGFALSGVYVAGGLALLVDGIGWSTSNARVASIMLGVFLLVLAAVRFDIGRRQRRAARQRRDSQAGT